MSKLPFLCQRCHVTSRHPPTVYDGFVLQNSQNANKIFGRAARPAISWCTGPMRRRARRCCAREEAMRMRNSSS